MAEAADIQYIVFGYVSTWRANAGYPLAVLTLPPSHEVVRLYTAPDWKARVPEDAVSLIGETFADWESLSPDEAARSFPHLAQSSAGSFQALRAGTCSNTGLRALLNEELGIRAS